MYIVNTSLQDVTKEFEFVNSWIDTVCQNILNKDKENCKITVFYNYGYFVPKKNNFNSSKYDVLFDDRLICELLKVRVNVTLKIDEFMMTNRLKKGLIPDIVKSMVTEITKYKMTIESEFHENDKVKKSIPDFDENVISIEVIRQELFYEKIEEHHFNLDDILDKITKTGLDSLNENEKNFLDKKSKEM